MFLKKYLPSKKYVNFFLQKHRGQITARLLKQKHGFAKYSVVSACYNQEKWLDEFISSIVNQRLDFKENIELILVDDGSKDSTVSILKSWQRRYPDNIKVITKENGGQSSARNLGLTYASNEWVIFADADDFFSYDAFYEVDKHLRQDADHSVCMAVIKQFVYVEKDKSLFVYGVNHFTQEYRRVKVRDLDDITLMATHEVFMRKDCLLKHDLKFSENCRPNFEDANLMGRIFVHTQDQDVILLGKPVYFYRIRSDNSSGMNTSLKHRGAYINVYDYGVFPLLDDCRTVLKQIPKHIQYAVLSQLVYPYPTLIDHDEVMDFLSVEDKARFLENMERAYRACDYDNIVNFPEYPEDRDPFIYVVGGLGVFRSERPPVQRLYISDYDPYRNEVKVYYYSHFDPAQEKFLAGDNEIVPLTRKKTDMIFVGKKFVSVHTLWLSLKGLADDARLSAHIDIPATLVSMNGALTESVAIKDVRNSFRREFIEESSPYAHAWLIYEQGTKAEAIELYRHIRKSRPEVRAFIVVGKHSPEWQSLKSEGIALIGHHGKEHKKALRNCDNVIITQRDDFTLNYYYGSKPGRNKPRLVYLDCPDAHDDLLSWIDTVNVDLFIGGKEHTPENIAAKFTAKEYRSIGWKAEGDGDGPSDERTLMPDHDKIIDFIAGLRK